MRVLVTGAAGFIGFHLAHRLLSDGVEVVGIDGMTSYYDVALKRARLAHLSAHDRFSFHEFMLEDADRIRAVMRATRPDVVVHLAAQAGVRYSLEQPRQYIASNIVGTFNLFEACRGLDIQHVMFASTSSAYGGNTTLPFRETDRSAAPMSIYAATKLSGEVLAHTYAHLWRLPVTSFRFFTVYGPWGRPDMSLFLFTRKILAGEPVDVYGHGRAVRDFTYVGDLVESIHRLLGKPPAADPQARLSEADTLSPVAPYRLVNIGGGQPVSVSRILDLLEASLGRSATRVLKDLPPGDVEKTEASTALLRDLIGYVPVTPVEEGIAAFVDWYVKYTASQTGA
ncbi:SDR family NAD(P)-dependent oxidoreductase [Methylobacterium organophilum]|uniref:SDR family NAD(P)-dependent oxidoreductase n=1 Tax=Methylobacterium organophilum TaxID=410 RepID=UPI001F142D3D|nr:SDR family NAD(P)-dependent oxidoreductase [Methylobacterium organophilum]UMY16445.1 SDR family NAD(P)-dependent oxidoreductase [Methylobacterium organophilum]